MFRLLPESVTDEVVADHRSNFSIEFGIFLMLVDNLADLEYFLELGFVLTCSLLLDRLRILAHARLLFHLDLL